MPRLEGEKQSVLPYILGIALVAAIGAGAYFYAQSNQENSAANNTTESFARPNPTSNNFATDNSATDNASTDNVMPSETEMGNTATENSTTENSVTGNSTNGDSTTNSVSRTSPTTSVKGGSSP